MITITVQMDGNQVCALFGENLQEGIAGFGDDVPMALRDLANNWQAERGNEVLEG